MKKTSFKTEAEMAALAVDWLIEQHWEVYQEVKYGDMTADIVACPPEGSPARGRLLWVIEAKLQMGVAVLEQAHRWRQLAHRVSVVTPHSKCSPIFGSFMHMHGIGWIAVDPPNFVTVVNEPRLHRSIAGKLHDALCEEQKTWAVAGSQFADRYTPFKGTCRNLEDYVKLHPGCLVKDAIEAIEHHYRSGATARSVLPKRIRQGFVPGIEARLEGRAVKLYLKN